MPGNRPIISHQEGGQREVPPTHRGALSQTMLFVERPREIITVDGNAGTGKTTIAREIAREFGWTHFSSGYLYRTVAYFAHREGLAKEDTISKEEQQRLLAIAAAPFLSSPLWELRAIPATKDSPSELRVFSEGREITTDLENEDVAKIAAKIAPLSALREILYRVQREYLPGKHLVVDGRDQGVGVFPDAAAKFWIERGVVGRAISRTGKEVPPELTTPLLEEAAQSVMRTRSPGISDIATTFGAEHALSEAGRGYLASFLSTVLKLKERDSADRRRKVAPSKPAKDAITVTNGEGALTETLSRMQALARAQFEAKQISFD